jgi:transposase-like protein
MKKQRKHYLPEEKVAILRRHLLDKEPISALCDELGIHSAPESRGWCILRARKAQNGNLG